MPEKSEWPQGEKHLCVGKLGNDSKGCGNPEGCKLNHKEPKAWSARLFEVMQAHVAKHPILAWNPSLVTPEMLGLELNKSPSKVAKDEE